MATPILLDTSIFIDFLRKGNKSNSLLFRLTHQYEFITSAIVTFELEVGIKSERHQLDYAISMENVQVLPIDYSCIRQAVEAHKFLQRHNSLIGLADLLIAATALHYQLPLATLNERHFSRIPHLELLDISL